MISTQEILRRALLLPFQERSDMALVLLRDIAAQELLKQALLLPHEERTDLARELLCNGSA